MPFIKRNLQFLFFLVSPAICSCSITLRSHSVVCKGSEQQQWTLESPSFVKLDIGKHREGILGACSCLCEQEKKVWKYCFKGCLIASCNKKSPFKRPMDNF